MWSLIDVQKCSFPDPQGRIGQASGLATLTVNMRRVLAEIFKGKQPSEILRRVMISEEGRSTVDPLDSVLALLELDR